MRKLYGQNLKKLQQDRSSPQLVQISHTMFAERADEIFRKFITLVNISAHLAYESFLAFRCRLWFYIVLIVVVGHGLDFGDHTGLGNAADEHSVFMIPVCLITWWE